MLVWLASYPRSGNTLLRQVLKTCFDLDSCDGLELVPEDFRTRDSAEEGFYGGYFVEGDPGEFYRRARSSSHLVLVKTHQLPRDDSKTIYVVRDGRLALKSYVKFQETYHSGTSSFESLLVGDHPYGEWSSHFHAWSDSYRFRLISIPCGADLRPAGRLEACPTVTEQRDSVSPGGNTLVVRFEELVNANEAMLANLAAFLGLPGPVRPWVNPQAKLRELSPAFFGSGHREWQPDPFWTETRLRQFFTLHGSLLVRLGYVNAAEATTRAYPADSDEARLLRFAHDLAARRNALQRACDDRRAEIEQLSRACDERLSEIRSLKREADARLSVITELNQDRADLRIRLRELDEQARSAEEEIRRLHSELQRRRTNQSTLSRLFRRFVPR